jgi:hypothetical protein
MKNNVIIIIIIIMTLNKSRYIWKTHNKLVMTILIIYIEHNLTWCSNIHILYTKGYVKNFWKQIKGLLRTYVHFEIE